MTGFTIKIFLREWSYDTSNPYLLLKCEVQICCSHYSCPDKQHSCFRTWFDTDLKPKMLICYKSKQRGRRDWRSAMSVFQTRILLRKSTLYCPKLVTSARQNWLVASIRILPLLHVFLRPRSFLLFCAGPVCKGWVLMVMCRYFSTSTAPSRDVSGGASAVLIFLVPSNQIPSLHLLFIGSPSSCLFVCTGSSAIRHPRPAIGVSLRNITAVSNFAYLILQSPGS